MNNITHSGFTLLCKVLNVSYIDKPSGVVIVSQCIVTLLFL